MIGPTPRPCLRLRDQRARPVSDPLGAEPPTLDALVIGAGQSGLAAAYHLRHAGFRFTVLEAAPAPGGSWPNHYHSLRLFSAARYSGLPGMPFPGEPDHLPLRDEVTRYLRDYARHFSLPVSTSAPVASVRRDADETFTVTESAGPVRRARTVIVATGAFRAPRRPDIPGLDRFKGGVIHSSQYTSPAPFVGRRVVVVGAGNSAVQIAVELADHARVTLATREPVRFLPHRIAGRDLQFWLKWTGLDRCRALGNSNSPVIDTGDYTRRLRENDPEQRPMFTHATETGVVWPDGRSEPVDHIILATGYTESFPFLDPLPDAADHHRGLSRRVPGLAFVGRCGQNGMASATLRGSGRDARLVVRTLRRWLDRNPPRNAPTLWRTARIPSPLSP